MKRLFFMCIIVFFAFFKNAMAIDISAECACLINADTMEVLYEKNSQSKHSIASTTKIMTGIIALESGLSDEYVKVSKNASMQEGSSVYLKENDVVLMKDLVYAMMLNSGNDAACAVAEHIGKTNEKFSWIMTNKAKEIGAKNTSFKNANGLDEEGHFSTAYDLSLITAYALKNEEFLEIVSTKNKQISFGNSTTYLKNHNKLLWNYEGCTGVKTGYTKKTGRCLVSSANKNGVNLIAVTLNAPDDWQDHKKMLDFGFSLCDEIKLFNKGDVIKNYNIKGQQFNAVIKDDISFFGSSNAKKDIKIITKTIKNPNHSIVKGEKIGYVQVFYKDNLLKNTDLICDNSFIEEEKEFNIITIIEIIKKMLKNV